MLPRVEKQRDPRHLRGEAAERLAERHLTARGLTVVARNFRCRGGELDLICVAAGMLVVVEVRQRAARGLVGPLESICGRKLRRMRLAAEFFRLGAPRWRRLRVRFDVVAVQGEPGPAAHIEWIRDAFR
jgi:putative endonuclease